MAFGNDIIDNGVPKAGSNDKKKMPYGSVADQETASLLGGREDKGVKNLFEKTGLSRLGFVGSLVAFLALSSAAFVLLTNRNGDTGMTVRAGLFSGSSSSLISSSSIPEGVVYWTNDEFTQRKRDPNHVNACARNSTGYPIFVIEGFSSCEPHFFQTIMDEANMLGAYIIAGDYGTEVLKTIDIVHDELECNLDESHPDYCLVLTFNCGSVGDTLLSVNRIDNQNDLQKLAEVDTGAPNGVLKMSDIIGDTIEVFDLLSREDLSDGELQLPYVLEPVEEMSRDECRGARWTDPKTKVYHLTIETANHTTVAAEDGIFQTRTMNGKFFGPLIKIKRGETFRVFFDNKLEDIPGLRTYQICHNTGCKPNYSNLHYHGAHVSGEEPSDDVELSIAPGECYNYESYFPENHMPGTHWIHPHFHGSSTIQVGGGASLPFIVEDDPDVFPIPPEVETANDVMLYIQNMNHMRVKAAMTDAYRPEYAEGNIVGWSNLDHFKFCPRDQTFHTFRLVNGQYRPSLKIKTGQWNRFRIVYAGWEDSQTNLDLKISHQECEQYLLAKDGIYIKDYPRKLDYFPVPAGGRADIMVRCNAPGKFKVTHTYNTKEWADGISPHIVVDEELVIIESEGPPVESLKPLTKNFEWQFPSYLQDVIDEPVLMGEEGNCSCVTNMDFDFDVNGILAVNGHQFEKHTALHTIEFGQVVERQLIGMREHPYHQHVYPFQLSGGFDPEDKIATHDGFFLNGDWHDNIRVPNNWNDIFIKYNASVHEGKVILHCHRLLHEDYGMMSQEHVSENHKCQCNMSWVPEFGN